MERVALVCPVCGAPYRDTIPVGMAQVKCHYCGASIVIPTTAPRCPNHPHLIAGVLCNDCGRTFCRDCLSPYFVQGQDDSGTLFLCDSCLAKRNAEKAEYPFLVGVFLLILGVFAFIIYPMVGILWIVFLSVPAMAYGILKRRRFRQEYLTYGEKKPEASFQQIEAKVVSEYTKTYRVHASVLLENRLKSYMKEGMSYEEALRRLAEDEGYI